MFEFWEDRAEIQLSRFSSAENKWKLLDNHYERYLYKESLKANFIQMLQGKFSSECSMNNLKVFFALNSILWNRINKISYYQHIISSYPHKILIKIKDFNWNLFYSSVSNEIISKNWVLNHFFPDDT